MAATYIDPFDFRTIFVDVLLGGTELFIFAFVILLSYISAKYDFSNQTFLILLAISSLIFAGVLGQSIYILVIFLVGVLSFIGIKKIIT